MKKILAIPVLILPIIFLTGCIKDIKEIENIESFEYRPSFSIPVGPLSYTLEDIMPPDSLSEYAIPDTSLLPDTISTYVLIYNDILYFENPEAGFSTSFSEPVNFSNLSQQSENVESAMLKTILTNNLPLSINMQVYFLDEGGIVLDSVSESGRMRLARPVLDNQGAITQPSQVTLYTFYNRDEVEQLMRVTSMEIFLHLETYNEGVDTLRVYSWNGLGLQLALRADLVVPFSP